VSRVEVTVYLLDDAGKPIAEEDFTPVLVSKFSDEKPLKPGYVETLQHTLQKAPKTWSKKVRVEIKSVEFAAPAGSNENG
jgi:hypothetical protein